jgi:hypothetical protein
MMYHPVFCYVYKAGVSKFMPFETTYKTTESSINTFRDLICKSMRVCWLLILATIRSGLDVNLKICRCFSSRRVTEKPGPLGSVSRQA